MAACKKQEGQLHLKGTAQLTFDPTMPAKLALHGSSPLE